MRHCSFYLAVALLQGATSFAQEPELVSVPDEEASAVAEQTEANLPITAVEGVKVRVWAPTQLLGDPVGIDIDHTGRAWVTVTGRRRTAKFDIRNHEDWMTESLSWTTVAEREAFLKREFAPERSEQNQWLADANGDGSHDWRDLTVAAEKILSVEDRSGDGRADTSQVFISNFRDVTSDVAGTVLRFEDAVYAGIAPDLWRLTDSDNDGDADEMTALSSGYSVHIGFGGHGVSGLRIGPAGRLYWSIGDVGLNVVDAEGRRWEYPHQGAIMRCEPDGSNFEVYAAGQRNVHEFDFDKFGNLIGVDNDGDHAGETERLVYIINGADSGWRINWQFGKYTDPKNNDYKVWMDEDYYKPRFEDQAAHILPPLAPYRTGPAGLVYNPGTALSPGLREHFFVAEFTGEPARSAIHAFSLEPSGAAFKLESDQKLVEGILAVGLDFGPDGALYAADWVEGWAPNGMGRIWQIVTPLEGGSEAQQRVAELLAAGFEDRSNAVLLELLGSEDMRVRLKAQFELAERGAVDQFQSAIDVGAPLLTRIHGIWGLAQIGRREAGAVKPLLQLLEDDDAEIRAQAAKWLGDVRYKGAAEALAPLLEDESMRVQLLATEALGRLAYEPSFDAIVAMLEANEDQDVYLRHAGAIALARLADADSLAELSEHPSRAVRIAAVVALMRLQSPHVARFLEDEDEFVATNAARAINDDAFIEAALPDLARVLSDSRFINVPLIRRAINANAYVGGAAEARRLVDFALREDVEEDLRVEALAALEVWESPSLFDRVSGRYRGPVDTDVEGARRAMSANLEQLLKADDDSVRIAAVEAAAGLTLREQAPILARAFDSVTDDAVRAAILDALRALQYDELASVARSALSDDSAVIRQQALSMVSQLGLPPEEEVALLRSAFEQGGSELRQAVLKTLGELDTAPARAALGQLLTRLEAGDLPRALELDLLEAIESSEDAALQKRLANHRTAKEQADPLSQYSAALAGGDPAAGRKVFYEGAAAACIRCHAIDGEGGDVGPDLSGVANLLNGKQLLESLVAPSERIAPGYGLISVTMRDGRTVAGILKEETESALKISVGGEEPISIDKANVANRINAPSSMPPMGPLLSQRQLRDVVAFLETLK